MRVPGVQHAAVHQNLGRGEGVEGFRGSACSMCTRTWVGAQIVREGSKMLLTQDTKTSQPP